MSLCEAVGSSECAREGGRRVAETVGEALPATGGDLAFIIVFAVALVLLGSVIWFFLELK